MSERDSLGRARPTRFGLGDVLAELARLASRTVACEFCCCETRFDAAEAAQGGLLRIAQLALIALVHSAGIRLSSSSNSPSMGAI